MLPDVSNCVKSQALVGSRHGVLASAALRSSSEEGIGANMGLGGVWGYVGSYQRSPFQRSGR